MTPSTPHRSIVSVWHAASSSGDPGPIEQACESLLDEAELSRASRFRKSTSRNQHVIGRGMSRHLLGRDTIDARSIRFAVEAHGKPFVTEPAEAKRPFNVTHTDGLVMCALGSAAHALVGLDVERIARRTDPEIADRYFSVPEIRFLNTMRSEETRKRTFLRIWTLKESFIKAIGTGLQTPLADFAFEAIESETPTIRMLNPALESELTWWFFAIEPRPGFVGAIAVAMSEQNAQVGFELNRFDDLIV